VITISNILPIIKIIKKIWSDYRLYDYPGRYKVSTTGKVFTRHKWEAMRVGSELVHGVSDTPLLMAGHGFVLTHHPDGRLNRKWRLLSLRHEGVQPQALGEDGQTGGASSKRMSIAVPPPLKGHGLVGSSYGLTRSHNMVGLGASLLDPFPVAGDGDNGACRYSCVFTVQDGEHSYRPPQLSKPLVDGPQIAHVVGPEGEEIHTDEYGRVKVHFPWDRHKKPQAEDSSCWIRVASNWAGAKWGHIAIPRIGQEVIVEFLEGDPDQPIITGRTYHALNQPPYTLPNHKTRMTIRSDSYKGNGFNELSFEDTAGEEQVYLHAQRDKTEKIGRDHTARVDNNSIHSIGHNKAVEVFNNSVEAIGGDMIITIGPQSRHSIIEKELLTVKGGIRLAGPEQGLPGKIRAGEGHLIISVEKDKTQSIGGTSTTHIRQGSYTNVDGSYEVAAVKNISFTSNGKSIENIATSKMIQAGDEISFTAGSARIVLKANGEIHLTGTRIFLNGDELIKTSAPKIDFN